MKKGPIIFFGNERLASGITCDTPIFLGLIKEGYEIAYLVVNNSSQHGRNKREIEIIEVAKNHSIPILVPENDQEILDIVKSTGAEVGVLAAFGKIVSEEVIDAFKYGILNIHPSLLPKHRGSTPIETAILEGDEFTGVTLMSLQKKMDAGPLYGFGELKLDGFETKQELYELLSDLGTQLLIRVLPTVLEGQAQPVEQDEDQATYTKQLDKSDSLIDWSKPAQQIEREIRAYAGWPGSKTILSGKEVTITEAKVLNFAGEPSKPYKTENNELAVYCGRESLIIEKLKPSGKNEMSGQDFLRGNPL